MDRISTHNTNFVRGSKNMCNPSIIVGIDLVLMCFEYKQCPVVGRGCYSTHQYYHSQCFRQDNPRNCLNGYRSSCPSKGRHFTIYIDHQSNEVIVALRSKCSEFDTLSHIQYSTNIHGFSQQWMLLVYRATNSGFTVLNVLLGQDVLQVIRFFSHHSSAAPYSTMHHLGVGEWAPYQQQFYKAIVYSLGILTMNFKDIWTLFWQKV